MPMNPVGWFEIYVDDMDRAKKFYESVFKVSLDQLPGPDMTMYTFPMQPGEGGASGALVKVEGMSAGSNSILVYFNCEDCATEGARVVPNGGKIVKEKFSIGQYGFVVLAHDTEGNMIGLHSHK